MEVKSLRGSAGDGQEHIDVSESLALGAALAMADLIRQAEVHCSSRGRALALTWNLYTASLTASMRERLHHAACLSSSLLGICGLALVGLPTAQKGSLADQAPSLFNHATLSCPSSKRLSPPCTPPLPPSDVLHI